MAGQGSGTRWDGGLPGEPASTLGIFPYWQNNHVPSKVNSACCYGPTCLRGFRADQSRSIAIYRTFANGQLANWNIVFSIVSRA